MLQPGAADDDEKRVGTRGGRRSGGGGGRGENRKTHDDEHRDISFGVRSREFASSKTSKRPLRVTGCPAACDTVLALCTILPRDRANECGGKEGKRKGKKEVKKTKSRRTTREDEDDDDDEGKLRAYRSARCSNSSEACRLASTT